MTTTRAAAPGYRPQLAAAELENADLRGANLRGVNLSGANLDAVATTETDMSGVLR